MKNIVGRDQMAYKLDGSAGQWLRNLSFAACEILYRNISWHICPPPHTHTHTCTLVRRGDLKLPWNKYNNKRVFVMRKYVSCCLRLNNKGAYQPLCLCGLINVSLSLSGKYNCNTCTYCIQGFWLDSELFRTDTFERHLVTNPEYQKLRS